MHALTDDEWLLRSIAIVGIVATQIMNISSIPSIVEIIRARSTMQYPTFPYSVSIVGSTTSIIYSIVSDQIIVGISSMMTVAQCLVYGSVHVRYSTNRPRIFKELILLALVVGIAIAIGPLFACTVPDDVDCASFSQQWLGVVMAIVSCVRYSAQSVTVFQVIKSKNSASISPYMTAGALLGSLAWTVYSILAGDPYYLASGVAGTVSSLLQVWLLMKYPRTAVVAPADGVDSKKANYGLDEGEDDHPIHALSTTTTEASVVGKKEESLPID